MSKYFDQKELRCPCGKCNGGKMDEDFMILLDALREKVGPLRLSSAYRCSAHNKAVGGVGGSQHLLGRAVDILCSGKHQDFIKEAAWELGFTGFGFAKTFLHLDTRTGNVSLWKY